jgi:hypothetical protein
MDVEGPLQAGLLFARRCEERSDEAIQILIMAFWIASLRSQ